MTESSDILNVVVMAAGKGTRMHSSRPKVLHALAGRSLLQHVLAAQAMLQPARTIVVTGHGAEAVEASVATAGVICARQQPQLGTGHAVQQALPHLAGDEDATVLVLNGDVPLVEPETLRHLIAACGGQRLAILGVRLDDATGYGRIVREGHTDEGTVLGIVEHKDASAEQRRIREIYTGVLAAPAGALRRWLGALRHDNAAGEYYLTDIVAMAVADGTGVVAATAPTAVEVQGINDAAQLAGLERLYQQRAAARLLAAGTRLADPARFDLRGTLDCGRDVEIDVGCIFEGAVVLGDEVSIGAHCVLRNVHVAAGARIEPYTHSDGGEAGIQVGAGARVGPYARLRAGATLGADVHIGNFVEVKNATLGAGTKANHLAYVGDATVGARTNIGAGSITANYDGVNKHRTTIGDDVQVGSNCVLVAPIRVGDGATIGAGSTVSRDAPAGQLTVARARQATLAGWKRPVKVPRST